MEKNNKRGVTLLETVIAMALFVIISVASYMTCDFALKTQKNSEIKNFFTQEVENIAMCYYKSDNEVETFENALLFSFNKENAENYFEYTLTTDEFEAETITHITFFYNSSLSLLAKENKENAKYKIVFDFDSSKITAISTKKNNIVFERQV